MYLFEKVTKESEREIKFFFDRNLNVLLFIEDEFHPYMGAYDIVNVSVDFINMRRRDTMRTFFRFFFF